MQIADHRQAKPMRYYRFTFEQADRCWSEIFEIEIERIAFNAREATEMTGLSYHSVCSLMTNSRN